MSGIRNGFYWLFAALSLTGFQVQAQDTIPNYAVDSIQISDKSNTHSRSSWLLSQPQQAPGQTLAGLLQQQSGMYIKSYGPGALASPSLRGGSASQTQVVWNGLPINSQMHGQSDLNLIPTEAMGQAELLSGGSVSEGGTGAVSGLIQLRNSPQYGKGWGGSASVVAGSFGASRNFGGLSYSNNRFFMETRAWHHQAANDFSFRHPENFTLQRQTHAGIRQEGALLSGGLLMEKAGELTWHTWVQSADRNIPPTLHQSVSDARQGDGSIRSALNWKHSGSYGKFSLLQGYSRDRLNFHDGIASIYSRSVIQTWVQEGVLEIRPERIHQFKLTGWSQYSHARQQEGNLPSQTRIALTPAYAWKGRVMQFHTALRNEAWFRQNAPGWLLPLPEAEIQIRMPKAFTWRVQGAALRRLPSFNDLYWTPGGNPDLKPENGYTFESGFSRKWVRNQWTAQATATGFYTYLRNRILWKPGPVYWYAGNVEESVAAGGEWSGEVRHSGRAVQSWASGRFQVTRAYLPENPAAQLFYIPLNSAGGNLGMRSRSFSVQVWYSYTGFVYTTSDQSRFLPAWSTFDITLDRTFRRKAGEFRLFVEVRNLSNTSFQVMENRPMPGRNFLAGIQWVFHAVQSTSPQ